MERYAAGDDAAFGQLYDALAPRLYGYVLRRTGSPSSAEDLVQQTLLQLHRGRGSFIAGASVLPWVLAIARRLIIDTYRRDRREVPCCQDDTALLAAVADDAGPEAQLRAVELAGRLRETLAKLPENQRVAFELLKQDGLSLCEAAAVLGTTETAVKLRAHRAYEALRVIIDERAETRPAPRRT